MKRVFLSLPLLFTLFLLSACAQTPLAVDRRWASVQGGQLEKAQPGEEFYFTVPVDQAMLSPQAVPIHIQVSGSLSSGSLRFELRGPDGQPVWNSGQVGPGSFSFKKDYTPAADRPGDYKLGLVYGGGTSARYDLAWHALDVGPEVLIPGAGMIIVALGFILYGVRRDHWQRAEWRYFGLGALLWVVTVAAKFAWAIPVNPVVFQALKVSPDTLLAPGNLAAYVYIGALTGIFEAGLAWLILRRRWGKATWAQALAFGIGFGAIEALLLGFASFGSGITALAAPGSLPTPTLAGLARQATLVMAPAPVLERLFVILAHIFACTLLFYAIATGRVRWVLLAILYKTILDTPAGVASFWNASIPEHLWTIEALVAVTGLVGLWGIRRIARVFPKQMDILRNL